LLSGRTSIAWGNSGLVRGFLRGKCGVEPRLKQRLERAIAAGFEADAQALRTELAAATHCVAGLQKRQRKQLIEKLMMIRGTARTRNEAVDSERRTPLRPRRACSNGVKPESTRMVPVSSATICRPTAVRPA